MTDTSGSQSLTDEAPQRPQTARHPALQRTFWMRVLCYGLFISSVWTNAGMAGAVFLLHGTVLYHRARQRVQEWLPWWVWVPFVGLFVMMIVSSLASTNALASLQEAKGHYRIFLPFVLLPALALVDVRRLLRTHWVFACLISVYALEQYIWGGYLFQEKPFPPTFARGSFNLHLTFAGVMLMVAPVYASLGFHTKGRERALWLGGAALTAVAVIVSQSRGGWLGLLAALFVVTLRLPRRWSLSILAAAAVMLATLGVLLATGEFHRLIPTPERIGILLRMLSFEQFGKEPRLLLGLAGWHALWDAPLLGHGFIDAAFEPFRKAVEVAYHVTYWGTYHPGPHNTYLQMAFYLGLPGLLFFLWIWVGVMTWCIQWIRRARDRFPYETDLLWGIFAALCGSMVNAMGGGQFFDAEVQINFWMWMGLGLHVGLVLRRALAAPEASAG